MKDHIFCEVISIESLRARSELIRKSAMTYLEDEKDEVKKEKKKIPSQKQIDFAKTNKDELPEHEKAIIHLHYWENFTIRQIADFFGLSYKLVQLIKNDAIHRLRLNYLIEFSQPKKKGEVRKRKSHLERVS
jgi:DNA-directed RNA polymerase specialized sigma subunit